MSRVRTAGVVGTGLIGTSVALALREAGWRTLGFDRDPAAVAAALAAGALHRPCPSLCRLAVAADVVFVAVPPSATPAAARAVLGAGARAVTDVASVKGPVLAELGPFPRFVGGHPMAGSERGGAGPGRPLRQGHLGAHAHRRHAPAGGRERGRRRAGDGGHPTGPRRRRPRPPGGAEQPPPPTPWPPSS